ncbi:MAG: hypothetical protein EOP04_28865, partial [Proteobacteria bacterium]
MTKVSHPDLNDISLRTVEIELKGKKIIAKIIKLGVREGMTLAQASKWFNTSVQNIRKHLIARKVSLQPLVASHVLTLKQMGVIPLRNYSETHFIPKEGIEDLVRCIDTEECDAVYKQLWKNTYDLALTHDLIAEFENRIAEKDQANAILKVQVELLTAMIASEAKKALEAEAKLEALTNDYIKRSRLIAIEFPLVSVDAFGFPKYDVLRIAKKKEEPTKLQAFCKIRHLSTITVGASKSMKNGFNLLSFN